MVSVQFVQLLKSADKEHWFYKIDYFVLFLGHFLLRLTLTFLAMHLYKT